ncbi:hypothetical protein RhiirB3_490602 [Rhizophagus irregularis]|nr:hypothetical protein RhiirB3_490602 [Rhizophagus irregularis]
MSITLLCLVKGNTTASAFPDDINKDQLVGHLKEAIKESQKPFFDSVPTKDIKLWKVPISDDHVDPLSNLSLEDSDELLAINEIGDYWTEKPPKRHIHVIVSPPETTASDEVLKLREEVASLKEKLSKSEYALENDGAVLNFMNDMDRYYPRNDPSFREMLRSLVLKNNPKFTVFIETPSKPFNSWTFPKMCELYGLSDDPNPSIDVYPVFHCGCVDLGSKAVVKHLMAELRLRQDVTPLDKAYEATKTIYSYSYLATGVSLYKDNFKLIPEKLIEGRNGQGNLDYAIECRSTGRILGVIEVKKEDFMKEFAQASVQMESTLTRKRKADEINNEEDRVFGIVTDASEWYFMECKVDSEGKPSFKLSEPVTVVYKDDNLQAKVEKVLRHIVWLLEEAQKSEEVSKNVGQERHPKKQRSTGFLHVFYISEKLIKFACINALNL